MKNLIKTIAILLAIIISGCSKDDDGGDSVQPEQNIRLKSRSENTIEYNYNYNDDGSLKSYQQGSNTINIIYDAEGRIKQRGTVIYNYNAQGRISEITANPFESNIVYNNEGLIAYFFSRYNLDTSTTTFEYDSNNRLISALEEESSSFFVRTTLTYDANDNIEQKLVERSSDGIFYEEDYVQNFTYDSKENPFFTTLQKMGVNSNFSLVSLNGLSTSIGNHIAYGKLSYYSKNNLTSMSSSSGGMKIYEYVYDENNFPISAEMDYTNSSDPSLNYTVFSTWTYETY